MFLLALHNDTPKGLMMNMVFKHDEDVLFNSEMVTALNKGEILQIKGGWGPQSDVWTDWKPEGTYFGPWYYHKQYEWRVKPEEIEVDVEREVKTVVKSKVEIPAPFKGIVPENSQYSRVFKSNGSYGEWCLYNDHFNSTPSMAAIHVKKDLVYLDKDTAQKAFDILTKG